MNFEEYATFIWLCMMSLFIVSLTFVVWMQGKTIDEQEEIIERLTDRQNAESKEIVEQ